METIYKLIKNRTRKNTPDFNNLIVWLIKNNTDETKFTTEFNSQFTSTYIPITEKDLADYYKVANMGVFDCQCGRPGIYPGDNGFLVSTFYLLCGSETMVKAFEEKYPGTTDIMVKFIMFKLEQDLLFRLDYSECNCCGFCYCSYSLLTNLQDFYKSIVENTNFMKSMISIFFIEI